MSRLRRKLVVIPEESAIEDTREDTQPSTVEIVSTTYSQLVDGSVSSESHVFQIPDDVQPEVPGARMGDIQSEGDSGTHDEHQALPFTEPTEDVLCDPVKKKKKIVSV